MASVTFNQTDPIAPSATDALVARESGPHLEVALAKANGTVRLRLEEPGGTSEAISVPSAAFRLLLTILSEMAKGNAVRVIPHHAELTTGEAAELLNVSRPFVVRLLDEGHLPSHRVGTHRRVLFKDVMAYRDEHYRARSRILDEMAAIDQELGLH
jgi:excisionase family DNA binding protein